jgi:hypothetical protein
LVSRRMVCYSVYDNIVILLIEELCWVEERSCL